MGSGRKLGMGATTITRAAVGAMPAGLLVVDEAGIILLSNPGAVDILSQPEASIVGNDVGTFLAPLGDLIALSSADDDSRSQLLVDLPGGRRATIGFTLSSFSSKSDEPAEHHVVLFQDISEYIELRRERDRLLQLAAVGDILPSLLHELRNPIASVSTALEVLLEDIEEEELQESLHAVLAEVRRVQLGLQGIGTVGRDLSTTDFHAVDQAIRDTCGVMNHTAQESGVKLEQQVVSMPLLPIDSYVLRGILYNLLNNAIAACRGHGHIKVSAELVGGGKNLLIIVEDTGHGMAPDVLARCTELFFTTKARGSGIGLALCHRTVQAAGGKFVVQSQVDKGTRVTIGLPIKDHGRTRRRRRSTRPPA